MFLKSVLKPVRYCIGVARLLPGQPRILQSRLQILSVSTLHSQLDHSSRALIIRTEAPSGSDTQDHQELKFPYVFLRDNCPCEECLHPVSKGRLFQLQNLDPNITPKKSEVTGNGELSVTWPDDHKSVFKIDWLKKRKFSQEGISRRLAYLSRPQTLWNAELQNNIPTFNYDELMTSKKTFWQWLVDMEEIGLTLITGASTRLGVVKEIGQKVSFLKSTNYGETFHVEIKENPSNASYTTSKLGLHMDLPQYNYTPGVQLLHCIKQRHIEGGENMFCDAFYVARKLRENYPQYYKILTTLKVDFHDIGTDAYKFHIMNRAPTIVLDSLGNPTQINYSNLSRDSVLNIPLMDVQPFYEALCKIEELIIDKTGTVTLKLKEGEIVCFNNCRVLHGRNSYNVLEGGDRHLEGGYIDWDEMKSRRRVLEEELGLDMQ